VDKPEKKENVYSVCTRLLRKWNVTLETSHTKATLSHLRSSLGRDLSQTANVWKEVFSEMPTEFLSMNGIATKEEKAIFSTLQLYAMHQQGKQESVDSMTQAVEEESGVENKWKNLGYSLSYLRTSSDSTAIDRRFNAMITSTTFEELIVHLRHLVSILKSKTKVKINYAKLAEDLFWFQMGQQEKIRLLWGQTYYRKRIDKED
jgi:CRISPR system Cascade subunit CasB